MTKVLALVGRYNAELVLRNWDALLSPAALEALRRLEERVELDAVLATRAHGKAGRALRERRLAEASRLVGLAASVVRDAVPDRLSRLRGMAVCCRMASALLALPPLVPGSFRLREIATLAGFALPGEREGDERMSQLALPVFWGRGTDDEVIPAASVARTQTWLPTHADLDARIYEGLGHSVSERELADVTAFLRAQYAA